VNLALSVSLAWYLTSVEFTGPHAGLALATSVAAILNAALLYRGLRHENVLMHTSGWPKLLLRVALANTVMSVVLMQMSRSLAWWIDAANSQRILWLAATVVVGAGVYFIVLLITGMRASQFRLRAE
jgi:putative peptidoglycan lipid II flippase